VDWFNAVDTTYRADLRELNELNFARFDAKLEQRLAEFEAKLEKRLAELDAKWRVRWDRLDAKIDRQATEVRAELQTAMACQKAELVRLMFAFWLGTILPLGGLIIALHRALM